MKSVEDIRESVFGLCHPIYRQCCATENRRYSIRTPFLDHPSDVPVPILCATDGTILVVGPASDAIRTILEDSELEQRVLPKIGPILSDPTPRDTEVTIPPIPRKIRCDECGGIGKCFVGGYKWEECETCEGEGEVYDIDWCVPLGNGIHIATKYAALLVEHGAKVYLPPETHRDVPIRFTVDEITGYLMRKKTEDEIINEKGDR